MRRGPKYKPTALKLLTGSRQPLNKQEPRPDPGLPKCPARFKGEARRLWRSIGKQLADCGIVTQVDGTGLELLIDAIVTHQLAAAEVARSGMVWIEASPDSKIPRAVKSPYWVVMVRTAPTLLAMLREYGMTPSARSSLKTATVKQTSAEDPSSRYFGGPDGR